MWVLVWLGGCASSPVDCPAGMVADGARCVPEACGTGPFGDRDGDVYVQAGATGRGTREDPTGDLEAALDAGAGGIVVVGEGTWSGGLRLEARHAGTAVAGRCADLVTLAGTGEDAVVTVSGTSAVALSDLRLSGGVDGLEVEDAQVTATRLRVEGLGGQGVSAAGASSVTITDSEVRDVAQVDGSLLTGGIRAWRGAAVDAWRTTVEDVDVVGLAAAGEGTTLRFEDGAVGAVGGGVDVVADAVRVSQLGAVHLAGTTVTPGPRASGATVDTGGTLALGAVTLTAEGDWGVFVGAGGALTAVDTRIDGARTACLTVAGADAWAGLDGVALGGCGTGDPAAALLVQDGADVEATEVVVEGARAAGVLAEGGTLQVDGLEVRGTRLVADGGVSAAIAAARGGELGLSAVAVVDNDGGGILAWDLGTQVRVDGGEVRDTHRIPAQLVAVGVAALAGADVELRALTVTGTEGPGVYAAAAGGARVVDSVLDGNTWAGAVAVAGPLELDGVEVRDNAPDASLGGGVGVYATDRYGPAALVLTGGTVGPHPYAAVWVDGAGPWTLSGVDLAGSAGVALGGGVVVHGNALVALRVAGTWTGGSGLWVGGSTLHDAADVAVLLDGSTGSFPGDTWSGNGLDLVQQACDDVAPIEGVEGATIERCPDTRRVVDPSLVFPGFFLDEPSPEG